MRVQVAVAVRAQALATHALARVCRNEGAVLFHPSLRTLTPIQRV
jgi:hypothetical protein